MDVSGIVKWSRDNWNKIPAEQRKRALDHLDGWIKRETLAELKEYRHDPEFHLFGGGMSIRNRLREVMPDQDLPGVRYPDLPFGQLIRNWDDYYQGALDELLERLNEDLSGGSAVHLG